MAQTAQAPMRLVHLSDFHLFAGGPVPELVRPDIATVAATIIDDIARFPEKLDAILFTGDLAGNAVLEDYQALLDLLRPLGLPVFAIPGNHDAREPFRQAFGDTLPFEDDTFLHYRTAFGSIRIIALDTMVDTGGPEGELCPRRLAWIKDALSEPVAGPTYILMHHPPYRSGVTFLDGIGLVRGGKEFAGIVRSYPGDLRIATGHIHRPSMTAWNGAFAMVGGSPAFTIALDYSGSPEEPPLVDAPYAYFIHHLNDDGSFAVSPRYVALPPYPGLAR